MASAYREPQMHSGEADKWLPKKLFSDLDVHAMLPTQEYTWEWTATYGFWVPDSM